MAETRKLAAILVADVAGYSRLAGADQDRTWPGRACDIDAPASQPRMTDPATRCQKLPASEALRPGRHHVGIPGDIISGRPDDFAGIHTRRNSFSLSRRST